jgi:hypothetical protein
MIIIEKSKMYSDYAIKDYFYKLEVISKHSKNCKKRINIETSYSNNDMEAIESIKKWISGWNSNVIFLSINIISKIKNKKKTNLTCFKESVKTMQKHPKLKKFFINKLNEKEYKKAGIEL